MKFDLRSWLVRKIAGDRFVLLNAVVIYKFHPLFVNGDLKPIVDNNSFTKNDKVTPFAIYASHIFDTNDGNLELAPLYKDHYEKVIEDIVKDNADLAIGPDPDVKDEEEKPQTDD